jgi:hypothetical protein
LTDVPSAAIQLNGSENEQDTGVLACWGQDAAASHAHPSNMRHTGIHSSDMDVWGSWRMPALYLAIEQEHQDLHNNISKECGPLGNAAKHCYPYAYFHSLRHCSREFLHVAICMPCVLNERVSMDTESQLRAELY